MALIDNAAKATIPDVAIAEESEADFRRWVRATLQGLADAQAEEKKMLKHIRKLLQYHGVTLDYLVRSTEEADEVEHG